jgi:hypothetical protein
MDAGRFADVLIEIEGFVLPIDALRLVTQSPETFSADHDCSTQLPLRYIRSGQSLQRSKNSRLAPSRSLNLFHSGQPVSLVNVLIVAERTNQT